MTDIWTKLAEPFPSHDIQWRVGSTTRDKKKGMALPYVTARAIMERLDSVVGPENWGDEYRVVERPTSKGWLCHLRIAVDGKNIYHEDGADETQIEGTKGGISDALKRAAVKFGIGRYLYRLPAYWVPLKNEKYLEYEPPLPAWALPGGSGYPPGEEVSRGEAYGAALEGPPSGEEMAPGGQLREVAEFAAKTEQMKAAFDKLRDDITSSTTIEELLMVANAISDMEEGGHISSGDVDALRVVWRQQKGTLGL